MADIYRDLCADATMAISKVGADDPAVYFGTNRVPLYRTTLIGERVPVEGHSIRALMFAPGRYEAMVAGQNDRAYRVFDDGDVTELGPCYGRSCVALAQKPDGTVTMAYVRDRLHWDLDGDLFLVPESIRGTSQGFAKLLLSGEPIWHDDLATGQPRIITVQGYRLRYAVDENGVWLGQLLGGPDQLTLIDQQGPHTIYQGLAFEPHLTRMTDGRLGACWRT